MLFENLDRSVRVCVDPVCLKHWEGYRQTRIWHRESGGLLFAPSIGSVDGAIRITNVSGPNSEDRRSRFSVVLNHTRCISDIASRFEQGLHFVGYWHTHPERNPSFSGMDERALVRNIRDGGLEIRRMFAVVVGNESGPDSLNVSIVDGNQIVRLRMTKDLQ